MLHWTVSIIGIAWILLINNDAGLATVVARSRSLTHSRHLQAANAVIVGVNESTRGRFNSTLSASSPYIEGLAWFTGTEEEAPSGRVPGCAKVFQSIFDQIDRNSPTFSLDVQEALQQLQQEQSTDGHDDSTNISACVLELEDTFKPRGSRPGAPVGGGFGVNQFTGWEYSLETDCYRTTADCPSNMYCQVNYREQFFPYSDGFINRGRCVPYVSQGMTCTGEADTLLSEDSNNLFISYKDWASPPLVCAPGLACAKDIIALPGPTCVERKSIQMPCNMAWPVCAGQNPPSKSENGELDWDTLVCPSNSSCMTIETGGFTRKHLEACVAWSLTQFTGAQETLLTSRQSKETLNLTSRTVGAAISRTSFSWTSDGELSERAQLSEERGVPLLAEMGAYDMGLSNNPELIAAVANAAVKPLWPFPICQDPSPSQNNTNSSATSTDSDAIQHSALRGDSNESQDGGDSGEADCTRFPIQPVQEPPTILGASPSRYHCNWGVVHTLLENGPTVLTPEQVAASHRLIDFYQTALQCKLCRTNFAHIVKAVGLPEGQFRETHAAWWWSAHNNANEHVVSAHSQGSPLSPGWVYDWTNPGYARPFYTTREVARKTWLINTKKEEV